MPTVAIANIVKKHPKAVLTIDGSHYRLYADVVKRRTLIYHNKPQALKNYRRAIRGFKADLYCRCATCQSSATAYGRRDITASARQAGCLAYIKQA